MEAVSGIRLSVCPQCERRLNLNGVCEIHGPADNPNLDWWKPAKSRYDPNLRGLDFFSDIDLLQPRFVVRTAIDAGANTGQTAVAIKRFYPSATVHSFEPVSATYAKLLKDTEHLAGVTCHRLAVSSESGREVFVENRPDSENNSILPKASGLCEPVETVAGDDFCARHGISSVDYLKVDTEGHDMEVLNGFRSMLGGRTIRFVEVEAAMHSGNKKHVQFQLFLDFFRSLAGYEIFGFYEQAREADYRLRRANVVFVTLAARMTAASAPIALSNARASGSSA